MRYLLATPGDYYPEPLFYKNSNRLYPAFKSLRIARSIRSRWHSDKIVIIITDNKGTHSYS